MTRVLRASAVLLASVVLTSCAARSVTINELKADPGRYQNKSVSVTGTVTTAFGASIVPVGMYTIQDGTGEINVLARERGTPTKGAPPAGQGQGESGGVVRRPLDRPAHTGRGQGYSGLTLFVVRGSWFVVTATTNNCTTTNHELRTTN